MFKGWHFLFFIGVIGLNVLMFFRGRAFELGGPYRVLWTALVLSCGGLLLYCISVMRKKRLKESHFSNSSQVEKETDSKSKLQRKIAPKKRKPKPRKKKKRRH